MLTVEIRWGSPLKRRVRPDCGTYARNGSFGVIKRGFLSLAVAILAAGFALTDLVTGTREVARLVTYSCAGFSVVSFLLSLFEESRQQAAEEGLASIESSEADPLQLNLDLDYGSLRV